MSLVKRFTATSFAVAAALAVGACAADSTGSTGTTPAALVVYGSGAPGGASFVSPPDSGITFGGAASFTVTVYSLYVSANNDCSNPVLVQDLGANGVDKEFMSGPVLFEGSPAAGTYPCVMMKMSDVLRMKPSTTFGACNAGTEYSGDIYRDGESDWVDVNLATVTGTGTETVPSNDHVTIFITRDPSAAQARGISEHQLVGLQTSLVVPGQSTFHVDASNAVATDGTQCGMEKPVFSFH